MVTGAEQSRMLISCDWISLWLFKIQTMLMAIIAHLNGNRNEPFLKPADAEQLMLKLIVAYKYAARQPISSMMLQQYGSVG